LLPVRQHALGLAEVHDDVVTALEATDDAPDELALAVLELVINQLALGVPHSLEQDLLGGLRGDAPEGAAGLLHVQNRAKLLVLLPRPFGVARVPENLEAELLAEIGFETVLAREIG
jgi:hypothetical protein